MESQKSGAASLRAAVGPGMEAIVHKGPAKLDEHAKKLYEWLGTNKVSRIRTLAQ